MAGVASRDALYPKHPVIWGLVSFPRSLGHAARAGDRTNDILISGQLFQPPEPQE